jgi:PIN domain nuclease of toxin-antitoxin system
MGERLLIILDTHIFLWLSLSPERIPSKILDVISAENNVGIPSISLWEIVMLAQKKRIELPKPVLPWLKEAISPARYTLLPITLEIAAISGELAMHGDPADRLITATAIGLDCPLATVDRNLLALSVLKTV